MRITHLLFALFCMPVVAVGVLTLSNGFKSHELKVLGEVPEFSLLESSGDNLELKDLKGNVWIANFIFTHCSGQCPMVTAQMKRLQRELRFKDRVRFVSFSVDPERDTPEALKKYAQTWGADPQKWFFVTGRQNEVHDLVRGGFKLGMEKENGGVVSHSFKLVLVDEWGKIRGYYEGMEEKEFKRLVKDTRGLLKKVF